MKKRTSPDEAFMRIVGIDGVGETGEVSNVGKKKKKEEYVRTDVLLTKKQHKALKTLAAQSESPETSTMSKLVRLAIDAYLFDGKQR